MFAKAITYIRILLCHDGFSAKKLLLKKYSITCYIWKNNDFHFALILLYSSFFLHIVLKYFKILTLIFKHLKCSLPNTLRILGIQFNLGILLYFYRNIYTNQPGLQEHVLKQLQLKSKELLKHKRLVVVSIDEMKGLRHLAHFELMSTGAIKIYSFKDF